MMITVFDKEVFNLFATNISFIFTVDPAEGWIGLKHLQSSQRLSLPFNGYFFLSHHNYKCCKSWTHYWCHLFIIALIVTQSSWAASTNSSWCIQTPIFLVWFERNLLVTVRLLRLFFSHSILFDSFVMDSIPLLRTSQWRQISVASGPIFGLNELLHWRLQFLVTCPELLLLGDLLHIFFLLFWW